MAALKLKVCHRTPCITHNYGDQRGSVFIVGLLVCLTANRIAQYSCG